MRFEKHNALDDILAGLIIPYRKSVPNVDKIVHAMIGRRLIKDESEIVNDHIAFRTLGVPNLGIASLEKIFLHYGYHRKAPYYFAEKKLDAYWYEAPQPHQPRIFISKLRVDELSEKARAIISKYTRHIAHDPVNDIDLNNTDAVIDFFYQSLWDVPTVEDYQCLLEESEYAAWVIYNRYYLNHYTISVHALPGEYSRLEVFNDFLESIGVKLNTSGGKIKTSEDGLLKQSSSVAEMMTAGFANGETLEIAGSYVEFAERLVLPEYRHLPKDQIKPHHRREGFESANADKIFESTYLEQVRG